MSRRLPSRARFGLLAAAIILAVIGGWWYYHDTHDIATVFNRSLAASLATKQVEQKTAAGPITITTAYDIAKPADPRVSVLLTSVQGQRGSAIKGYGSNNNLFMAFTKTGTDSDKAIPPALMDKWVQLRKDGKWEPGASAATFASADPHFALFGQFIFGNFAGKDRQDLQKLLAKQPIYTYDPKAVTRAKLNARDVMVYKVKINPANLTAFNKRAAAAFGMKDGDIQLALAGLSSVQEATMYIETGSKHLAKVEITEGATPVVTTYANYNRAELLPQPKPDMTYQQYAAQLAKK